MKVINTNRDNHTNYLVSNWEIPYAMSTKVKK